MITTYSPITVTKKLMITALAIGLALSVTMLSLSRPAAAVDCVRAPHTVTISPESANQTGMPGTTLWYYMEITNNDSAGCGVSDFTFDGTNIPADWTVTPYRDFERVDSPETTGYSMSFTSGAQTYNGTYAFEIEVYRAEEATTVKVPITYTVTGGQDVPAPDTYPVAYITSPAENSTVTTNSTATITANASDDKGVTNVTFLVNGVAICSGTATSCQWAVPAAAGSYNLQVRVTDTKGQVTTGNRSVTSVNPPDTTKPVVTITSPSANTTVGKNTTVTIRATASDNVGITKIEYYVNNTLLCTGTATSCSWRVPNTRASYTLTVKAYDAAGNVTTKSITVQSR